MDIPTALLYTIISTVAEMAMTPSADSQSAYETAAIARTLPPEAKQGVMLPPAGDGFLIINGRQWPLAPTAQIRSRQNLIVMPMAIQRATDVVYLNDNFGAVHRIWLISRAEADSLKKN